MHWHVANFLSEHGGLRSKFSSLLAGLILSLARKVRAAADASFHGGASQSTAEADLAPSAAAEAAGPEVAEFAERLIREEVAPELFALTTRMQRKGAPPRIVQEGARPLPGFLEEK